jgi:hypothetical protein
MEITRPRDRRDTSRAEGVNGLRVWSGRVIPQHRGNPTVRGPGYLPGVAVLFVLRTITWRGRYSSGTAPIMGSRSGAQGASPTYTPFRHFRYACAYGW